MGSNPAGCTISIKNPCKKTETAYASKLARRFYFLLFSVALHPRDFGGGLPEPQAAHAHFAALVSNPVGCTILLKTITQPRYLNFSASSTIFDNHRNDDCQLKKGNCFELFFMQPQL